MMTVPDSRARTVCHWPMGMFRALFGLLASSDRRKRDCIWARMVPQLLTSSYPTSRPFAQSRLNLIPRSLYRYNSDFCRHLENIAPYLPDPISEPRILHLQQSLYSPNPFSIFRPIVSYHPLKSLERIVKSF